MKELIGKTLVSIEGCYIGGDEIIFKTACSETYRLMHYQDCCEYVCVVDVIGDVSDIIGHPLIIARESNGDGPECGTWTFYTLATIKGYLDIRWLGESNGYHSERVTFERI